MITTDMIQISSVIGAIFCLLVIITWRGIAKRSFVAVHWLFFLAMGIGLLIIWWFYENIERVTEQGGDVMQLIATSRFIYEFIAISSLLMAVGAIVYWMFNVRDED